MLDGVGYLHDVGPFLLAVVQATVKDKKPVGDLAIPGRHTTGVVLVDQTLRFAKKKGRFVCRGIRLPLRLWLLFAWLVPLFSMRATTGSGQMANLKISG